VHETAVEMSQRVRLELAGAGFDFIPGANEPVEWSGVSVGQVDREAVSNDAIAGLSARRSAWSEAELTAGVDAALTASTVVGDHQAVGELAEDCRARARERCVSLLDPELSSPTAMSRHLSSEAVLASDMALNLGLAGLAGIEQTNVSQPTAVTHGGLDAGQAAALEAICGDRRLEVVIGPAGAGKTMMLAAARETLDTQSRDMVIVAPTRKAALVAGAEIGTDASSLSKLLYDHGYRWDDQDRWTRLAVGEADPQGRVHHRLAPEATLSQRSVIVVDEAALMTVSQANVLLEVCHESGAALRLVGDPRQLGAIGRGGVMETAARWAGGAVTLDEVHRFLCEGTDAAGLPTLEPDTDYASLSLAMRQGDDPDAVASRLIDRGGVVVHASHADAIAAIAEQVAAHGAGAGDGATAVTAATNEEALALNLRIRDRRVAAKQVDDTRVARGMDNVAIGAGDRIVTRRNDTTRDVANREAFTVEAIASDGTLSARAGERHVRLDASYVAEAVQLGYATTDYGNQGVTTDTSITLVSDSTSAGGLYVGATRGRYANTLHVVAPDTDQAREAIVAAMGRDRSDKGLDIARVAAEEASEPARREGVHEAETDSPATMEQLNEERLNRRAAQERADQEARATAAALFDQARQHRDLAVSLEAGLAEQASRAAAAFLADRNDARAIKAGPGLLGRRADAVSQAQCRRGEFARSWPGAQQAQWDWSDDRAVQGATDHVSQGVRQGAAHQRQQATALESQAQGYLDAIANREEAARMVALVAGGFPGGMSNPLRSLRRSPAPIAEAEVEKMPLSPAQSQDRSPEHGLEM
jgi:exodeoxyribonuclease V alpha subunit